MVTKIIRLIALVASSAFLLSSCSGELSNSGPVENGAQVSVDVFATAIDTGAVILDVRTPEEFAEGHLAGAINIDVTEAGFAEGVAKLDPKASYAVYCRSGNRSRAAVDYLVQQGFSNVVDLSGGIQAWSTAGNEIVK